MPFVICIFPLVKCLCVSFAHLLFWLLELFAAVGLYSEYSLYILDTNPLSDMWFVNIFFFSVTYHFPKIFHKYLDYVQFIKFSF
jgi:hypothetical protein